MRRRVPTLSSPLLAGLVALALTLALFGPSLLGGKILAGTDQLFADPLLSQATPPGARVTSNILTYDSVHVFHPDLQVARDLVRAGHVPTWSPYQGGGRPLLGTQQSAPLWPLNALAYLAPSFWSSLGWIAALTLLCAFGGMLAFCRRLGTSWPAAVLGALAYAYGTYLYTWVAHPHDHIYAMLPWTLFFVEGLLRTGRWREVLGIGGSVGLMLLGGHPQSAVLCLIGVGVVFATRLAWGPRGVSRRRALLGVVLGGGLALCIGAPMVLAFLEALSESDQTSRGGIWAPLATLTSFGMPELWGRTDRVSLIGPLNFQERTLYIGVAPVLLAVFALLWRWDWRVRCMAILAGFAALLAYKNPVGELLGELPLIANMTIARAVVLIVFPACVLAALGVDRLLESTWRQLLPRVAALGAIVVAGFAAWAITPGGHLRKVPDSVALLPIASRTDDPALVAPAAALQWLLLGAIAVALIAVMARAQPRARAVLVVVLIAFAAADLALTNVGYHPQVDRAAGEPPRTPTTAFLRANAGPDRVIGEWILTPNLASDYSLRDARAHELPAPRRYSQLWGALAGGLGIQPQKTDLRPGMAATTFLADIFSARWVLSPVAAKRFPVHPPGTRLLSENATAFPRAWVAYDWTPARNLDGSLRSLLDGLRTGKGSTRGLMDDPVVEGAAPPSGVQPKTRARAARIVLDGANKVTVRFDAARPGVLVLNDLYFDGWKAQLDGRDTTIRPANVAFRAVAVPAGRHEVSFSYRPASLVVGFPVSALAVLGVIACGVVAVVRRRRRAAATVPSA